MYPNIRLMIIGCLTDIPFGHLHSYGSHVCHGDFLALCSITRGITYPMYSQYIIYYIKYSNNRSYNNQNNQNNNNHKNNIIMRNNDNSNNDNDDIWIDIIASQNTRPAEDFLDFCAHNGRRQCPRLAIRSRGTWGINMVCVCNLYCVNVIYTYIYILYVYIYTHIHLHSFVCVYICIYVYI